MACLLLICCEGKTEAEYFHIVTRIYRPIGTHITILGEKGQHLALINHTIQERDKICEEFGYSPEDIECWAVCDQDKMSCTYTELIQYAEEMNINLAFSKPQFESFLLQHFEQSKDHKQDALFRRLSYYKQELGYAEPYSDSTKADLRWIADALDEKPKRLEMAIINAELRSKAGAHVFLTVQELVKRLKDLGL